MRRDRAATTRALLRRGVLATAIGVLAVMAPGGFLSPVHLTGSFLGASSFSHPLQGNCNTSQNSSSWAGYVVQTCTNPALASIIQNVSGEWIVPTATCNGQTTKSAAWIGMDGFSGTAAGTIEQVGTTSSCSASTGAYYLAWYEMWPANPVYQSLGVSAGDVMYGTVTEGGGHFFLTLRDATSGLSFSTIQNNDKAKQASAEWVVEGDITAAPVTDFGAVTFFNCNVVFYGVSGSISGGYWAHIPLNLTNLNKAPIAVVGPLQSGGSRFTVTFAPAGNCQTTSAVGFEWGGYVDTQCAANKGTITAVGATWVQPAPAAGYLCPPESTTLNRAYFGIALGGYLYPRSVLTMEGIGTGIACVKGKVLNFGWLASPLALGDIKIVSFTVNPGDTVSATVTYNPSTDAFAYTMTDVTLGQTTTINLPGASLAGLGSAEWIVQQGWQWFGRPTGVLLNFGSVTFTKCSLTLGGTAGPITGQYQTVNLTLGGSSVTNPHLLAAPGAVQSANSFTITWLRPF